MNAKGEAIEGAVTSRSKGVIPSSPCRRNMLLGSEEIKLHMTVGVHRMSSGHGGDWTWEIYPTSCNKTRLQIMVHRVIILPYSHDTVSPHLNVGGK